MAEIGEYYLYSLSLLAVIISGTDSQDMVQLDMCAVFTREFPDRHIQLVTPNYNIPDSTYPSNQTCYCNIETLEPRSDPRSLNVTVNEMDIEGCSTTRRNSFDYVTVRTTYNFQVAYQYFYLCGNDIGKVLTPQLITPASQDLYGKDNTIYSMGLMKVSFNSDESLQRGGAKLTISSYAGVRIACSGNSGYLYTVPTPSTTVSTTEDPWAFKPDDATAEKKEKAGSKIDHENLIGIIVGVIIAVFVLGTVILIVLVLRKKKLEKNSKHPRNVRPMSGQPVYKDPCQGRPDLPMLNREGTVVTDQYLYPNQKVTTPVYADPQAMNMNPDGITGDAIYMNGEVDVPQPDYQPGYIIPQHPSTASFDNIDERKKKPVMLKMQDDKRPMATPRLALTKTNSNEPLLNETVYQNVNTSDNQLDAQDTSIQQPPLVKPSQLRKQGSEDNILVPKKKPLPPTKPPKQDSPVLKPKPKVPPPAPLKPKKPSNEDAFSTVKVETTN